MIWPFTFVGAGVGGVLVGAPGILLGALLGQVLDRRLQLDSWTSLVRLWPRQPTLQGDELLFVLLGRLAKSSGRISEQHIQAARGEMRRRQLDKPQQLLAIKAFGRGKGGRDRLRGPLAQLQSQRAEGQALLQACWRMARATTGQLNPRERNQVLQWGQWLGWTTEAIIALDEGRRPNTKRQARTYQEALRLLGVQTDSEPAQIKQAYRRLLSQHHPDKQAGLGASAERIQEATELTQEIHEAYLIVRERHGFR